MNAIRTTLSLCCVVGLRQFALGAEPPGSTLTNAAQVHHLSRESAARGFPVRFKAVVTYSDPAWSLLFVHDASAGVFVTLSAGNFPTNSEEVEITGQTLDGGFLPIISEVSWRHAGTAALPEPRRFDLLERFAAELDCEWSELEGVVRRVELNPERNHFQLEIATTRERARVFVPVPGEDDLAGLNKWIDAKISVRGVAGVDYDPGGGLRFKLFAPGLDSIRQLERSSGDPFQLALIPLSKLTSLGEPNRSSGAGQSQAVPFLHRVHIRGRVTCLDSTTGALVLQEGDSALRVLGSNTVPCKLGDNLEAAGFVSPGVFSPMLEDALLRPIAEKIAVKPVALTPATVLWGKYDARLVSLTGTLQDSANTQTKCILTLLEDGVLFGATLEAPDASKALSIFKKGDRIQVTGVCTVLGAQRAAPQSFQVALRSPADVVNAPLVQEFSARQVLWIVVVAIAALGGVLLWSVTLRRRIRERTSELARSLSLLNATIESIAEGILVVDREGLVAGYNTTFLEMWRLPAEAVESKDDKQLLDMILGQLKDPEAFRTKVQELYANPETESFDTLEFKDGRVYERYSQAQRLDGRSVGRVWCFRDVTARKQADAKLAAVHHELLETSRRVGMAEVATAVLHNVGNVLNSVNVSATLVNDRLQRSRANNLAQAARMIEGRMDDLQAFLTRDPKGEKLCAYLKDLSQTLIRENELTREEVQTLRRNIEHIKTIVSMQQSYARVSGTLEKLDPRELMENALQINGAAYERDQIHVARDYQPVPKVLVDRHKVLQILINLLNNARHAVASTAQGERRVSLGIFPGDADRVCLRVSDNGSGIEPENLSRIFSQGFTTRRDGHGFGLHSGANAAKEMNGALCVQSDGSGKGAVFTLELPITNGVAKS